MLLPDSIELIIKVPRDSRNTAWVGFDGRQRSELKQGDYISIKLSRSPVPTVCAEDQGIINLLGSDWFESLKKSLHWNQRTRQKGLESQEFLSEQLLDDSDLQECAEKMFRKSRI